MSLKSILKSVLPRGGAPRRILRGPAKGVRANIDFDRDTAFYLGLHESVLHRHYRAILKPGMKVFDVGMYRGWDALTFATLTGGPVVSFDGNPDSLRATETFIAPAGLSGITLENAYVSDGTNGRSLDDFAAAHFMPDFVKMDIEGAEADALRGARAILSEGRPHMVIETHGADVEADCLATLGGHGYSCLTVDRPWWAFNEGREIAHNRWLVCSPD